MKIIRKFKLILGFLALGLLSACGGSGSGNGTLSVGLTDAPNQDYAAVYVTITEIQVHLKGAGEDDENGWITVANPNRTYNLLDLTDGVVEGLGEGPLAAGSYTQIRLIIGNTPDGSPNILCHNHPSANYAIDADDFEIHELKVPSGEQTGIKIVCAGKCNVVENQTTELILDFDASASITPSFNLKPTIKVLGTESFAIVNGLVTTDEVDPNLEVAIPDANVSAQVFTPGAVDPADQIIVQSSTFSDFDGSYTLFLRPGDYNLVAYHEGQAPSAVNFAAVAGQVATQDFALLASDLGALTGTVSIAGISEPTFAHLSIRQDSVLAGEVVEVVSADVLSGAAYSINLPLLPDPDYDVVASTCGLATQVLPVTVPDVLDVIF